MKHEIDDIDREIIEIVISFGKHPQLEEAIQGKMKGTYELDEIRDRVSILEKDYGFVESVAPTGTGQGKTLGVKSTPQGRQYLRDWRRKQEKESGGTT